MQKYFFFFFLLITTIAYTQKSLPSWNLRIDSMRTIYDDALATSATAISNYSEDSLLVKIIVRMLRSEKSYDQKWDSLSDFLTCIIAPDNRFKILSWKFPIPSTSNLFSYRGIIQINDKKNTLIPLFDGYTFSENRQSADGYNNPKNWFGATYYSILQLDKKQPIYTLFGLRQDDIFSDKKIIETLHVDKDNSISFGGIFELNGLDTTIYQKNNERFIFSFKKGTATTMQYEKDMNRIIFDQLTPISDALQSQNKPVSGITGIHNIAVPDGHYLGLKYGGNDTWFFVGNVVNLLKMKE